MKKLYSTIMMLAMMVAALSLIACVGDDEENVDSNEAKVCFIYTLETSYVNSMTRGVKTNSEVFDEFYQKIKTGELVAPSFELTLTEVNSGVMYTFKGKWNSHDLLTLRTGTYRVVGKSIADGDNIQEKCSFTFDEQIDISITSNVITLHAKYDSSLLIFNNEQIQTLQNFNGSALASFFTFSTYKYAFINNTLYDEEKKNEAYILGKYTDDAEFKIFTGNLNFEKGKYYVYNSISNGFDVPPMEEGVSTITGNGISTRIFNANSQPPIVGGIIDDYLDGSVLMKGIIVSADAENLDYDASQEVSSPRFFEDKTKSEAANNRYSNKNYRIIDCTGIGKEQFWCTLKLLEGNSKYFIRAFAIQKDGAVIYGETLEIVTKSYSRYNDSFDRANVWHAFESTLFDLVTDEIIDPNEGFYYSTNENPTRVRHQVGTGYNTCYKFLTEWNYKLWYYHSTYCNQDMIVNTPIMTFSNNKLVLEKNSLDDDKDITIYYSINGNYFRPEIYIDVYTAPIEIIEPCAVYCYAISSDGYLSYTNMYVIGEFKNSDIE